MRTPLLISTTSMPSASAARLYSLAGGIAATARTSTDIRWPVAGTFKKLVTRFPVALVGGTEQYSIALHKNGSDEAALTLTVTNDGLVDSVAGDVAASVGDSFSIRVVPANTPSTQTGCIQFALEFESTTSGESFIVGYGNAPPTTGTQYSAFGSAVAFGFNSTENLASVVVPTGGTISKLYVNTVTAPSAGNSVAYTAQKNGTDSALTCTIADTATTSEDTSNSFSVAAGDTISIENTVTGTAASSANTRFAAKWVPTTPGEAILFSIANSLSSTLDRYMQVVGFTSNEATETNAYSIAPYAFQLKTFRCKLNTAPGTDDVDFRSFTLRESGVAVGTPGNVSININGTATTGTDDTNTYTTTAEDLLSYITTPTSSPAAPGSAKLGIVAYTAVSTASTGGNLLLLGVG